MTVFLIILCGSFAAIATAHWVGSYARARRVECVITWTCSACGLAVKLNYDGNFDVMPESLANLHRIKSHRAEHKGTES